MSKRLELMVMTGELSGRRFAVPDAGLRLGRASSNDLHLPDEELSRNHCLFEPDGEAGLRVLDLASANGTYVNGKQLEALAQTLKAGDTVEVGSSVLSVVGEGEPAPKKPVAAATVASGTVDLGLGPAKSAEGAGPVAPQVARTPEQECKRKLVNQIWAVAVVVLVAAIVVVVTNRKFARWVTGAKPPVLKEEAKPAQPLCFDYERVEATPTKIERYHATVDGTAVDLLYEVRALDAGSDLKVERKGSISAITEESLVKLLDSADWQSVRSASGASVQTQNALRRWSLTLARHDDVKETVVENMPLEGLFKTFCVTLEADISSDLQVAGQMRTAQERYESGLEYERIGDDLLEHREVRKENLYRGVCNLRKAWKELDGQTGHDEDYKRIRTKLEEAEKDLDEAYRVLNDRAEFSCNIRAWSQAREAYGEIRELIPDKDDVRGARAEAQILYCDKQISDARASEKGKR